MEAGYAYCTIKWVAVHIIHNLKTNAYLLLFFQLLSFICIYQISEKLGCSQRHITTEG